MREIDPVGEGGALLLDDQPAKRVEPSFKEIGEKAQ